ncbi:MAG: prolyl oligopeptidase family serine peptidase [Arenibacter sp.]
MRVFGFLVIVCFTATVQAQSFKGSIDSGKTTFNYHIKLVQIEGQTRAFFSSLAMNAFEIPCQNSTFDKHSLKFYVISDYYTYEYQFLPHNRKFEGHLKVYSNETELLLNSFETNLVRENETNSDLMEQQELTFVSNDLKLQGTLWKPKVPMNKGLLFVTSSQGNDRSGTNAEAQYFANLGYTVFNYDKRGTGGSDGDWQSATIEELCADDINALEFFSTISAIPLSNIGIKGSSQGGIKIPYILSKVPDLGFGISISCPSGSLMESDLNHWKNLNFDQFGVANIDQALIVQKAGYDYLAGNINYDSLLEIKNKNSEEDWLKYIWIPTEDVQKDYKLNFSGLPYFEKITQPVLVIQGLSDEIIPLNSYKTIEKAIIKSNSNNYKVITLKDTSHSMMSVNNEFPYFQLLSADYLLVITNWLKAIETR